MSSKTRSSGAAPSGSTRSPGAYSASAGSPVAAICRATAPFSSSPDISAFASVQRARTIGGSDAAIRSSRAAPSAGVVRPRRRVDSVSSRRARTAQTESCAARAAVRHAATSRSAASRSPIDRCTKAAVRAAAAIERTSVLDRLRSYSAVMIASAFDASLEPTATRAESSRVAHAALWADRPATHRASLRRPRSVPPEEASGQRERRVGGPHAIAGHASRGHGRREHAFSLVGRARSIHAWPLSTTRSSRSALLPLFPAY